MAEYSVTSGQTSRGKVLNSEDILYVYEGGTAVDTTVNMSAALAVMEGGSASGVTANSGCMVMFFSGGMATGVEENGGYVEVEDGASVWFVSHTISGLSVEEEAAISIHSKTSAVSVTIGNDASLHLFAGGKATSTTIAGGFMNVNSGGYAGVTDLIAGDVHVYGSASSTNISGGGRLHVSEGGVAVVNSIFYGGNLHICEGGVARWNSVQRGGLLYVSTGGVMDGATVYSSGEVRVLSGGFASSATIYRGGTMRLSGGVADKVSVSSGGSMELRSGGTANSTTLDGLTEGTPGSQGGVLNVYKGCEANETTVSSGGRLIVNSGGTALGTVVSASGRLIVNSGGTALGTVVSAGGSMTVNSGGKLTGSLTIANGANVTVSGAIVFDLTQATVGAGAFVNDLSLVNGSPKYTLTVKETAGTGVGTYTLAKGAAEFDKTVTVKNTFGETLGSLRVGGEKLTILGLDYTLVLNGTVLAVAIAENNIFSGDLTETKYISSGSSAVDVNILDSGALHILNGGMAANTTVKAGGKFNISGGGKASQTTFAPQMVDESIMNVFSGGSADQTTVAYGTMNIRGTATLTTVNVSGVVNVISGLCGSATVNDGGVVKVSSCGTVTETAVNSGGILTILSSGLANMTTVNRGGKVVVSYGGEASGGMVMAGGSLCVSHGGLTKRATVSSGGTAAILAGGMASATMVVDNGCLEIHDRGSANNTVVQGPTTGSLGGLMKITWGTATATTVSSGGRLIVNFGKQESVTAFSGGRLSVDSGGTLTGSIILNSGAVVSMTSDSTLDFDLSKTIAGALVNDLSIIQGAPRYTLTVNDSLWHGTYKLAGGAAGFDKTLSVVSTEGAALGTLSLGKAVNINGSGYTLNLDGDDVLSVTVGAAVAAGTAKSDVDGNGISDVMFVWTGTPEQPGNYQHGYWMNGTNEWRSANASHPADWENLGCYDMSGDGKADSVLVGNVVVNDVKGAYIGYYADANDLDDGSTWVNIGYLNNADDLTWKNKVGNLTGNASGANSIVWHTPDLGALGAWTDGTDTWGSIGGGYDSNWTMIGCGDFDGDGADSVLMSYNSGEKYYAVNLDGTATELANSDSGWEVRAIGDFSGDGKDDIVAFHEETGLVAMWGDGDSAKWSQLGQLDAQDWFVVGAGDYDGDAQDDLLVRQNSTGMLGYYSSANMADWNTLGYGVDMSWTVIA